MTSQFFSFELPSVQIITCGWNRMYICSSQCHNQLCTNFIKVYFGWVKLWRISELIKFAKVFSHHCLTPYDTCMHTCILWCAFISATTYLHTIGYVPEQNLSHINICTMMLSKKIIVCESNKSMSYMKCFNFIPSTPCPWEVLGINVLLEYN